MLGRDHHDVSGTDSPYRETSNIKDGSNVMGEMAILLRRKLRKGMSLVALHNSGESDRQSDQRRLRPCP